MKRLAVLGASGHGKVVADLAMDAGWDVVEFFDDAWPERAHNGHWPVLGTTEQLLSRLAEYGGVVVAIGHCETRWAKHELLRRAGATLPVLVHPRAHVSRHAALAAGVVVMAGCVVNVDARIGPACIINTGATVDHDCELGPGVHVSPGAHLCGDVGVGACSWVGAGAVVRQGILIGAQVRIGAGAVVVKPVADGITAVGHPARPTDQS